MTSGQVNQYLLYTALLLGSIGAYGAFKELKQAKGKDSITGLISDAISNNGGELSAADVAKLLTQLDEKVSKMDTRVSDVEEASGDMDLELIALEAKVSTNDSNIAFITPDFQEQISLNKSSADATDVLAVSNEGILNNMLTVEMAHLELQLQDFRQLGKDWSTRISDIESARQIESLEKETLSSNILGVAEDVTTNLGSINAIETELIDVYTTNIANNADNVTAVKDDLSFLTGMLRREIFEDEGIDQVVCYSNFIAKGGAEISLSENPLRLGDSLDDSWMLYLAPSLEAKTLGMSTSFSTSSLVQSASEALKESVVSAAKAPRFEGMAARLRVYDSETTGFVVENSNDEVLFSVRGSDAFADVYGELTVDTNTVLRSDEVNSACFSHVLHTANPGIAQQIDGDTVVSGKEVFIQSLDETMVEVKSNMVIVHNALKVDPVGSLVRTSQFNYSGHNFFSAREGGINYFRFGARGGASVKIKHKEIEIDGTNVLATLDSLQQQITNLKNDSSSVKTDGTEYYIMGHNDPENGKWVKHLSYSGDDARWGKNNTRMYLKFYKK